MKKRVKALLCVATMVMMFCVNVESHAEELLCRGNHNYYHYTYLQNAELITWWEIPDGRVLPEYGWYTFEADRYGVCVCGAHSYLGKYTYTVKQRNSWN